MARGLADDAPAVRLDLTAPAFLFRSTTTVLLRGSYDVSTVVQVLVALGLVDDGRRGDTSYVDVLESVHARTGEPDLLTLQQMLDAAGCDGRGTIWSSYSASWGTRLGRDWPDEQVWPFVAHHLDWILATRSQQDWSSDEHAVFAALATFRTPPARVVDLLYAMALGGRKGDRGPAQLALARDPRRTARAAAALQDGKGETRLVAAQWLPRIADPAALPQLQAAWKSEKQDVIRGALLDALVSIGEDAETYLDPEATTANAEKVVARGLPAALAWLDWDAVPEVAWASSGDRVPLASCSGSAPWP